MLLRKMPRSVVTSTSNRYWWAEIAYVSNLVPWPPIADNCTPVMWSLGVEAQLFLVAMPLLMLYRFRPRVGVAAVVSLTLASCAYTVYVAFQTGVRFSIFDILDLVPQRMEVYVLPWFRCPVYFIGLLCGIGWNEHLRGRVFSPDKRPRILERTTPVMVCWAVSILLLVLPVFGTYWAYQDVQVAGIPAWVDHLYLVFSGPAWALGLALMCGLCFCGCGGLVNTFLALPMWGPFSRLTFCGYLVHTFLLDWLIWSRSTPYEFTLLEFSITCMGVTVGTFAMAAAVHLVVEQPLRNLEQMRASRRGAKERGTHGRVPRETGQSILTPRHGGLHVPETRKGVCQ